MNIQRRNTSRPNLYPDKSRSKIFTRTSLKLAIDRWLNPSSRIYMALAFTLSFLWSTASFAQAANPAAIREARAMQADNTGLRYPAGLAYSSRAGNFQVAETTGPGQTAPAATYMTRLTAFGRQAGSARIMAQITNPINVAFDNKNHRLLLLQFPANQLLAVSEGTYGNLDVPTLMRYDARGFALQNPQGMTVDPVSGAVFILDAAGPRVVRIEPGPGGTFDRAAITSVSLQSASLGVARGLALDPINKHLFFVSTADQKLHELTQTG